MLHCLGRTFGINGFSHSIIKRIENKGNRLMKKIGLLFFISIASTGCSNLPPCGTSAAIGAEECRNPTCQTAEAAEARSNGYRGCTNSFLTHLLEESGNTSSQPTYQRQPAYRPPTAVSTSAQPNISHTPEQNKFRVYTPDKCLGAVVNGQCHGTIIDTTPAKYCHGTMILGECHGTVTN